MFGCTKLRTRNVWEVLQNFVTVSFDSDELGAPVYRKNPCMKKLLNMTKHCNAESLPAT